MAKIKKLFQTLSKISIKDIRTLGEGMMEGGREGGREGGSELAAMWTKVDKVREWLCLQVASFSVWSLEEIRGHLKVNLSSSFCVKH